MKPAVYFRPALLIFLAISFLSSCTTRYYIVRHAEKMSGPGDVSLTQAGHERAMVLADSMADKGVDKIFVTEFQRTQQTGQPTADATGLMPVIINAQYTTDLVDQLKNFKTNKTILVVGHSNTIPVIIDGLMSSPQGIVIAENDFDNFYLVKISRATSTVRRLFRMTYGAPSP